MASRDELLDEIVPMRKKFVTYKSYADATIQDIFPADKLAQAKVYHCDQLASGVLYAGADGHFTFSSFPTEAQFSKIYGAVVDDFEGNKGKDILVAGNFFPYRTQLGRCDASLGLLMQLKGQELAPVDPARSGCYIGGDVRAMTSIRTGAGERWVIVAKNDDSVQVLKVNNP